MKNLFFNNVRLKMIFVIILCLVFFLFIILSSLLINNKGLEINLVNRNLSPSFKYFMGTDWLGRDMNTRIIKSIISSIQIGLLSAFVSSFIALVLGFLSGAGPKIFDRIITFTVDIFLSIPHLVLLILIAFVFGRGIYGVIIAVSLTHWPNLTRILRAEILQLKNSHFIKLSYKLGRSRFWIMKNHMLSHILSQLLIGLVLLFPHAVLHSAGLTFLGFGLNPDNPSIGVLLSESMRYIASGLWWLAFFPGIILVLIVIIFNIMGKNLKKLIDVKINEE